jgi:hypothetical protein
MGKAWRSDWEERTGAKEKGRLPGPSLYYFLLPVGLADFMTGR